MAKFRELIDGELGYYFKTSREMMWHLVGMIEDATKRDDLGNLTKGELCGLVLDLYENMYNQLNNSEE